MLIFEIRANTDQPRKDSTLKRQYIDLNKTRNWKKEDFQASYIFIVVCICYALLIGPIAMCDLTSFVLDITGAYFDVQSLITAKRVSAGLLAFYPLVISALYLFMARELFQDLLVYVGLGPGVPATDSPQPSAQQTNDHLYNL